MSYPPRPTILPTSSTTSLRQPSLNSQSSQQSSILTARIISKKAELENLKQLRDLSGALAAQMIQLEDKLGTLRDGTEAVACVLANWENVLRAISMASMKVPIPKDTNGNEEGEDLKKARGKEPLPVTLVRIPAQQVDLSQEQSESEAVNEESVS